MKIKCAYGIVTPNLNIENINKRESFNRVQQFEIEKGCFVSLSKVDTEQFASIIMKDFDELFEGSYDKLKQLAKINFGDDEVRLVAIKGRNYITIQIGQGIIADYHDNCEILSKHDEIQIKVQKGEALEGQGFLLISPIASKSLYPKGAESLSPACATFFEWLKEYDEEAVSAAIVDNIEKYFLKDDKEDVSIAFVLIEELDKFVESPEEAKNLIADQEPELNTEEIFEEVEETIETPEAEFESETSEVKIEPEIDYKESKETKKINYFKPLIAASIIIMLAISVTLTINNPIVFDKLVKKEIPDLSFLLKSEEKPLQKQEVKVVQNKDNKDNNKDVNKDINNKTKNSDTLNYEPTISFAVKSPESLEPGEYKIGVDIPAGEYFFWTGEMLEPGNIILNDDSCLSRPLYCMTVIVEDYDVLYSEYRFTRAENVNPIESSNGLLISGKYKIGKDIKSGEYKISPTSKDVEGRCYIVHNSEIEQDIHFDDEMYVDVPNEGYLVLYDGILNTK